MKFRNSFFILLIAFFAVSVFFQTSANAQRRDHLTDEEVELIRNYQEIDKRMEIYLKAIDRRFIVLNKTEAANNKQIGKDSDKWGELPKGSRTELYSDISKILDETISKIDDIAAHDMENKLLPNAVHTLADGCRERLPQIKLFLDSAESPAQRGTMLNSIEFCNQIIEASSKIAKPEKGKGKR